MFVYDFVNYPGMLLGNDLNRLDTLCIHLSTPPSLHLFYTSSKRQYRSWCLHSKINVPVFGLKQIDRLD